MALTSSLTILSLTSVVYIRMYALSTLNVLITTYLHLKLLDGENKNYKLFIGIGLSALAGSLTHYYYLFYLVMLFIMCAIKFLKEKNYQLLKSYVITMVIAGMLSILIFPFSIKHMFFGYRGQGAISNLSKISEFIKSIAIYLHKINLLEFNGCLVAILIVMVVMIILKKFKKLPIFEEKNKELKYMFLTSVFYFLLVAISAPWKEIRYMMPICGIIFILVFYCLDKLLENLISKKVSNIVISILLLVMLAMPFVLNNLDINNKYKPNIDVLYTGKSKVVDRIKELDVPTLYMAKGKNVRFQDDIMLFINISNSYIAEGIECNNENILNIMQNQNLSNGIVVFINEGQDNNAILEAIKNALNLEKTEHIERMNACDIYYLK